MDIEFKSRHPSDTVRLQAVVDYVAKYGSESWKALDKVVSLENDAGYLTIVWRKRPSEWQKRYFEDAWEADGENKRDVEHRNLQGMRLVPGYPNEMTDDIVLGQRSSFRINRDAKILRSLLKENGINLAHIQVTPPADSFSGDISCSIPDGPMFQITPRRNGYKVISHTTEESRIGEMGTLEEVVEYIVRKGRSK